MKPALHLVTALAHGEIPAGNALPKVKGFISAFLSPTLRKIFLSFFVLACLQGKGQIVINEVGIGAVFPYDAGFGGEFIELFNKSGCDQNIGCYVIVYSGPNGAGWSVTLPNKILAPGEYYLIGGNSSLINSNTTWMNVNPGNTNSWKNTYDGNGDDFADLDLRKAFTSGKGMIIGNLPNTGGQITLFKADGVSVSSSVAYNTGNNLSSYPVTINNSGCSFSSIGNPGNTAPYVLGRDFSSSYAGLYLDASGNYQLSFNDVNQYPTPGKKNNFHGGNSQMAAALPVVANSTKTNASCSGGSSASISATASGGTAPFTYSIVGPTVNSTGVTSGNFTGLSAGSYTITTTDAYGCTATTSQTVTANALPNPTLSSSDADNTICAGQSITFTASPSGESNYEFFVAGTSVQSGSSNTYSTTSLTNGQQVSVKVTDANGCSATSSNTLITVRELPNNISSSGFVGNTFCVSGGQGTLTFDADNSNFTSGSIQYSNGTTTYTQNIPTNSAYSFNAASNPTNAGFHNFSLVSITNELGCTQTLANGFGDTTARITVNQLPTTPNAGTDQKNCNNGSFTLGADNPSIGTGSWSVISGTASITTPSSATSSVTGISVGSSTNLRWTVTNGSCVLSDDVVLSNHALPVAAITVTDNSGTTPNDGVICAGGSATLTASGGTSYSWNTGETTASITVSPTTTTTYTVTVKDGNGCATQATQIITVNLIPAAPTVTVLDNCNNTSTLTASNYSGSLLWSNGQTSASITVNTAGTYTVTQTVNGCTSLQGSGTAAPKTTPTVAATPSSQTICSGAATNIALSSSPSGASYSWTASFSGVTGNALGTGSTIAETLTTSTSAGGTATYTITPTLNGCTGTSINVTITVNTPPTITVQPQPVIGCADADQKATFTASASGTPTPTIQWQVSGNGTNWSDIAGETSANLSFVISASNKGNFYKAVFKNVCNTVESNAAQLTVHTPISFKEEPLATQIVCAGSQPIFYAEINGQQSFVNVTWQYSTNNGSTWIDINNTSNGGNNNGVTTTYEGGTSGLIKTWYKFTPTATEATYLFRVKAENNCATYTKSFGFSITALPPPPVAKPGERCGPGIVNIGVEPQSGQTFDWYDAPTGGNIVQAGSATYSPNISITTTYYVVTRNASPPGCLSSSRTPVTATINPIVTFTTSSTNVSCFGGANGTASITPTTGTAPYTYLWNNGATAQTVSGLTAGTYTVTVTDAKSCNASASFTITQPEVITANLSTAIAPITCNGASTGSIILTVNANGGTGVLTYTYAWTGPGSFTSSQQNITALAAGAYNVTVTVKDANNCTQTFTTSVSITEAPALVISATGGTISCNGGTTTISVTASGGTPGPGSNPYNFSIDGTNFISNTSPFVFNNVAAGTYTIYVKDANGCLKTTPLTIAAAPSAITASANAPAILCNGGSTTITVTASGGSGTLQYSLDGTTFQPGNTFANQGAGPYTIYVKDANGCLKTTSLTIAAAPSSITASASAPAILCNGGSTTITVTASGGTPAAGSKYDFSMNGTAFTSSTSPFTFNNQTAGSFTVTVRDGNGCTATAPITIAPAPLTITVSASVTTICSGGTSTITVTASGGTGTLQYSIDNGSTYQSGNTFSKPAGTFTITVKDGNSCTNTTSVSVPINSVTAGTILDDQTICVGATPLPFTVGTAATGSGILTYQWQISTTSSSFGFSDISGATSATYSPGFLTSNTWYRRLTISTLNGIPCSSVYSNVVAIDFKPVTPGIIAASQTICSGNTPTPFANTESATAGNGGTIAYQWMMSNDNGTTWTNVGSNSSTHSSGPLFQTTLFKRVARGFKSGKYDCIVESNIITVTVNLLPVVSVINTCTGTSVTFSQTGGATGGTWSVSGGGTINASTGVFTPTTTGCFTATYTTPSPGCSDTKSFVVFPSAPALTAPANTCNAPFVLPPVTTVAGFTIEYNINGSGWAASPTIPTTPGCYSIAARYVLTTACGATPALSVGPASCATSNTVNVVVFPDAPPAPVVTSGCGAFTVTAPTAIPGFTAQYSFDDGGSWGANTPPTGENCAGYKIIVRYVTATACGNIPVNTNGSGACAASPATTRKVDNTKPVLTCPVVPPVCIAAGNNYTIPLLVASDNCSASNALTITYSITGVTTRNGTGTDASGSFNVGVSTITWTVTDECGNSNTCTTQVTINPKPTPTIYHN